MWFPFKDSFITNQNIISKLDQVVTVINKLIIRGNSMSQEIDRLTAEVTKVNAVQQQAIALIQELSNTIASNKSDPIALQALADSLDASTKTLSDAIAVATLPVE